MKSIPFSKAPDFSESVILDLGVWLLRFQWNSDFGFWSMSLSNATGPVIDGIRIVPNLRLLQSHAKDNLPDGDLILLSPNGSTEPVGRDNIGDGLAYKLYYLTSDEANGTI